MVRNLPKIIPLIILVLILALGATAGLALAANSSSNYAITRQVLAGGGRQAVSSSGAALNGTLGQPITGTSAGGKVVVEAGYWSKTPKIYVYYVFPVWR